jgi:hypothetical protein
LLEAFIGIRESCSCKGTMVGNFPDAATHPNDWSLRPHVERNFPTLMLVLGAGDTLTVMQCNCWARKTLHLPSARTVQRPSSIARNVGKMCLVWSETASGLADGPAWSGGNCLDVCPQPVRNAAARSWQIHMIPVPVEWSRLHRNAQYECGVICPMRLLPCPLLVS